MLVRNAFCIATLKVLLALGTPVREMNNTSGTLPITGGAISCRNSGLTDFLYQTH